RPHPHAGGTSSRSLASSGWRANHRSPKEKKEVHPMKRRTILFVLFLLLASSLAHMDAAAAQEPIPPEPPFPPMPPVWPAELLKIEYQRVDVTIADQVATTHVEQLFVNEGSSIAEGVYLFPLPEGAVVSELTMWVD